MNPRGWSLIWALAAGVAILFRTGAWSLIALKPALKPMGWGWGLTGGGAPGGRGGCCWTAGTCTPGP
jgi:hypothetical protein